MRRDSILTMVLAGFLGFQPIPGHCGPCDNPPPLDGWTHFPLFSSDSSLGHGVVLAGGDVGYGSPVIAEIDGDTSNGKEVAVANSEGILFAYKSNGELLWSNNLPSFDCSSQNTFSTPAVGDLDSDGVPDVVIGYGTFGGGSCDGGVIAYRGSDGVRKWVFSTKSFAHKVKFGATNHNVFGAPALADTDGDGKLEVGFGSFDRNVYLLEYNGKVRWYYNAADTVWSSPAFMNVDSDSNLEMIIGTDISQNKIIKPPTSNGGYVYAFKTAKRSNKHIQFRDKTAFVWQRYLDQVVYSSPVIADVLPSNSGAEIVVASGCFFPQGTSNKKGKWVKIINPKNGKVLQTLNSTACTPSNIAVGDIDDDGINEIVSSVNGNTAIGGEGRSRLIAWDAENPTPKWSIIPYERGKNDSYGGNYQSPVIADIDGNGSLEVLVANSASVGVFNGSDGSALTCQNSGCEGTSDYMLYTSDTLKSTPAVGDIDGDGVLDVVIGGGHSASGGLGLIYVWTDFSGLLGSSAGIQAPYSAPWPMLRGNAMHTGLLE